jgi:hypothetical protein
VAFHSSSLRIVGIDRCLSIPKYFQNTAVHSFKASLPYRPYVIKGANSCRLKLLPLL